MVKLSFRTLGISWLDLTDFVCNVICWCRHAQTVSDLVEKTSMSESKTLWAESYFSNEISTHIAPYRPYSITMQWHQNEFESEGHTSGAKRRNFLSCRSSILSLQVQLIVLVSAFVLVSTVWSVSCLLFLYSWCPRAQPAVKVGGTCPRALSNRRHCTVVL